MESILALVTISANVSLLRVESLSNSRVLFTISSRSIMVGIHLWATVTCMCRREDYNMIVRAYAVSERPTVDS